MCLQSLIELYLSKDFLLNVSAEALGVLSEVILITFIIGRFLDRREIHRWNVVFAARIKRLLEVHRDMPTTLASLALAGDVNIPYKISMWSSKAQERLGDALALIPPRLAAPQYAAAEEYLEAIRDLSRKFLNQEMPLSVLRTLNTRAEALATLTSQVNPKGYLWSEDFLSSLEPQLHEAVW